MKDKSIRIILLTIEVFLLIFFLYIVWSAPNSEAYTEDVPCYDVYHNEIEGITCIEDFGDYNIKDKLFLTGVFIFISSIVAYMIIMQEYI